MSDFPQSSVKETSFARAVRLAEERKAAARAAYQAGPQRWRDFDWRDENSASSVYRPLEEIVFHRLFVQTQRRNRAFVAELETVRRAPPEISLRDLYARRGLTLMWFDEAQQRLTAQPSTRAKVNAFVVPLKRS